MARLTLLFALLSAPLLAQSSSVDKKARLERLLQLMNMELVKEQMTDQVFRSLLSSIPSNVPREVRPKVEEAKRRVLELIKRRFSWQVMKPQYMKLYEEAFTDEEIDGMIAFYSTPGRSILPEKDTDRYAAFHGHRTRRDDGAQPRNSADFQGSGSQVALTTPSSPSVAR
jgi:uncharacterized protein